LKPYEMLVIIKPALDEDARAACRGRIEGWLSEGGAALEEAVDAGEMQFASEIKKHTRGRYILFFFDGPSNLPDALARRFRIDEDILRYLVLERHPAAMKTIRHASEDRGDGKRGK
jgi:small subunit ribosomal protein S6